MIFDELDKRMRVYETAHDQCVLPGIWIVARIDGRSFTRLTKESIPLAAPFDERFRDWMLNTTRHLMDCGFPTLYGYTQSDEISLLMPRDITIFGRKLRKYVSVLAGEASACFARLADHHAVFDCRISQLPNPEAVIDYFRWRNEDAARNALNAWCYWTLRQTGLTPRQVTRQVAGLNVAGKNQLLFEHGINFNDLPLWQKRGIGLYWQQVERPGFNPLTDETTLAIRNVLSTNTELPMKDAYNAFIASLLDTQDKTQA